MSMGSAEHWDDRYRSAGSDQVSWFQARPSRSLDLIEHVAKASIDDAIVDLGGGASTLVDCLIADGYRDVTVVDISQEALHESAARVAAAQVGDIDGHVTVHWVRADIRTWQPEQSYAVWHDRAAYHFLTDPADQRSYWDLVRSHLEPGGHVVIATFAADGPTMCSGLQVARYDAASLVAAMGEGFRPVRTERELHRTPSGVEQAFTWVVAERR